MKISKKCLKVKKFFKIPNGENSHNLVTLSGQATPQVETLENKKSFPLSTRLQFSIPPSVNNTLTRSPRVL
jgi:hypothetical protein